MTTTHNHEPWCCCTPTDAHTSLRCPLCPEHGELAQLGNGECPHCHQIAGRPHTDYCCTVQVAPNCQHPKAGYDGTRTTLAAGQTSTPPTQYRTPGYDGVEGTEWPRLTTDPTAHAWGQDTHYPPDSGGHHTSQCHINCPPQPTPLETGTPIEECAELVAGSRCPGCVGCPRNEP